MSLTIEYGAGAEVGGNKWSVAATNPASIKWLPSDPTSAHWYDAERLARLMGANIARAEDRREPCKTVRDFVGEFRGLTRTSRRAAVCDAVGVSRLALNQFLGTGTDLCHTGKLLDEMKRHSTPVIPKNLGAIGQDHFAAKFEAFGAEPTTFEYNTASITD